MDWPVYRAEFIQLATERGLSSEEVDRCLHYAERLISDRLPVIFDDEHLIAVLGFEIKAFRLAMTTPGVLYRTSLIPKRAGGHRRIDAPVESLMLCQTWILRNILQVVPCHPAATAFTKGRSIRDNAAIHVRSSKIISLDVKDFFPSLSKRACEQLFMEMGYSESATRLLGQIVTLDDSLPQGAPTSPALSNLLMRRFDARMTDLAGRFRVRYSRYADDITISGECNTGAIIAMCASFLADEGLSLNTAKTRVMFPHQRQEVTGVVVNAHMQAPRRLRRYLRNQMHMVERFVFPRHAIRDYQSYSEYRQHLRGVAEFILFINPEDRDARRAIAVLDAELPKPGTNK